MARNKQGLTVRQSKFLNTLAPGHMTVEQVERHLGLACYTLRRWMDQATFVEAWKQTNKLLDLRRGADDAIRDRQANAASDASRAAVATNHASEVNAPAAPPDEDDAAPRAPRTRAPAAAPQPKSDRELIRLRHGEEAARAFEDLLRRHAPPDPAADPPSPPPPPAQPPGDAPAAPIALPPPSVAEPVHAAGAG